MLNFTVLELQTDLHIYRCWIWNINEVQYDQFSPISKAKANEVRLR